MIQQPDGSAVIYVEIVMDPATVHFSMRSDAHLGENCRMLARDCGQIVFDFCRRVRPTYLEGRYPAQ